MSSGFNLGWGDEAEPEATADTLNAVDATRDQHRQQTHAAEIEKAVADAVEEIRPGLDKVPDPVEPAGEGALTAEERERLRQCNDAIDLHETAWFMLGKSLDTMATGRLFRDTRHKLEPERCYETIEEWAVVEKGISVSKCSQYRAAWAIGEILKARGLDANPGQVREIVPVRKAYGLNAAVGVYLLVAEVAGKDKVTAERLRETVKLLPGDLQLIEDDDPEAMAKVIKGVLLDEAPAPLPALSAPLRRSVDRRAVDLADTLGRGRIPRQEVTVHLLEAFADPKDTRMFDLLRERMEKATKKAKRKQLP
ncbi:hypothetical protein EV284_6377 [Streptomyces sp. BK022]|uniref:hypothetical protein n=1 Tax=Streptomyces sp. BK022 TaxID=2512123 RepID=UPI00102A673F|nr:hypothetical protein [Streptomyces sp. BK022]RZU28211.1 hypothetical protein EV284_6377 [Streptomyces sp. BK022]